MYSRPEVWGKFLFADGEKFYIRGVTYGPFTPRDDGCVYHDPQVVAADFDAIARMGANAVRTYTVPPRWLLDIARDAGLRVMVGFGWEQHITFLDERERQRDIIRKVRDGVRQCAGHPAVLCYTIGNEIPSPIVRWYGPERIERFLKRLYAAVKEEDGESLVTYVNYPTTEYLNPPGDFVCFNVFLESEPALTAYLRRLHNLSGDRPLVLAEIGLDSVRNGEDAQAESLSWQIRTAFRTGCAGAFVFSWTDEWHRGGAEIVDWGFGLTDGKRNPKKAFASVARAFADAPFGTRTSWPRISVIVCTYNGSRTIRRCCEQLTRLQYPDYEVIVVDDGSTDETAGIVSEFPVRLIRTPNQGLSAARNNGAREATGEIVAYIDDDAWPDPHWLHYLAMAFESGGYAAVGGPNIPPPNGRIEADCVASAPGGPVHVLLTDDVAEHIPGCNMAFRKSALRAVGGFDPSFRVAGDDVDICWRIQAHGWKIGFTPAATVWHYRRESARTYLKQQWAYGKAEAMLERKWPEKYNAVGQPSWVGRIYAHHLARFVLPSRRRIYHGTWGTAPFQSVYEPAEGGLASLLSFPEWYVTTALLGLVSLLGIFWTPLLAALPFLALGLGASLVQAFVGASRAKFSMPLTRRRDRVRRFLLTALLHFLQPIARIQGRLQWGLSPWRRSAAGFILPRVRIVSAWSESWKDPAEWLSDLERMLLHGGTRVQRGGTFDRWDLELSHGPFAHTQVLLGVEEHGEGRQLLRIRKRPRISPAAAFVSLTGLTLAGSAAAAGVSLPATALGLATALVLIRAIQECASTTRAASEALRSLDVVPIDSERSIGLATAAPRERNADGRSADLNVVEWAAR